MPAICFYSQPQTPERSELVDGVNFVLRIKTTDI